MVEYNKVMNDYQKKTGGGDGDEVLFVSWDERDPIEFLDYDLKVKNNVHLTIIHMYDKQFDFPLTVRVDCIKLDYTVDDNFECEGRSSNVSNKNRNLSVMATSPIMSNDIKSKN